MDSVGNEDDGDILGFLKVLDQPEELRGFRVAQGRGWLVQNQEITFVGYGAGDENHLLLREGEVLHPGVRTLTSIWSFSSTRLASVRS